MGRATKTIHFGVLVSVIATAAIGASLGLPSGPFIALTAPFLAVQPTPEKPLTKAGVDSLIAELARRLPDLVSDDEVVEDIEAKWRARKDLVSKTQTEALKLLFEDVRSEVTDSKMRNKVWTSWESRYGAKQERPSSTEPDCSTAKTETGTVKFFNDLRGYGFIVKESGGTEIFVHHTAIIGPPASQSLKAGDRVRFVTIQGSNGPNAKCVAKVKK